MVKLMQNVYYPTQLLRAFRQAPWRQQTQIVAIIAVGLMIVLVVGGLYLAVASRAGNAGRDLQRLEERKADLLRENDRLRANLADLRSMNRLAARALELGFAPANPEQVTYVAVPNYPTAAAPSVAVTPAEAAQRVATAPTEDWLTRTLARWFGGG